MKRFALPALVTCLMVLSASPSRADGVSRATPYMTGPDTVRADGELMWNIDYMMHNPLATGFFPDSFRAEFENADDVAMRGPRRFTDNIDALAKGILPISGGDSLQASYFSPVRFERGRLTLVLYGHSGSDVLPPMRHTIELQPGPFENAYPVEWANAGKARVELTALPPGNADARRPGVLLVHDETSYARAQLVVARMLVQRGYGVVLVSMPGFGRSSGPADWCGPATQAALEAAYQRLRALPGVDPARLAVWGSSRGATAAALLASKHPDLAALVLQSATYDPAATRGSARAELIQEAGSDPRAWKSRTVLSQPTPKCAVLLLHGDQDDIAPVEAARAYEAALRKAGVTVDARWLSGRGHELSLAIARSSAVQFLRRIFGS